MICKIQVLTIGDDGREETRQIVCLERTDLKPETLGMTLAEGKMILKDLQQIVVECQVASSLLLKRACPDCGEPRCAKGNHTLLVRTVFGQLTVRSPRLHHCTCGPHETKTFSPLAELLPDHTLPELLFLETKWASLMSYGMTLKLLHEVLPIDEPVPTFTLRQHVVEVAERLVKKQQMGWSQRGAHLLLQIRARLLDEEWENTFRHWYPAFRPEGQSRPRKRPDPPESPALGLACPG
jgi:hypothetical protein